MVTGACQGGAQGSPLREGDMLTMKTSWKGILAVGIASGKVLKQEDIRCTGEKERRPVWLGHDEPQRVQGLEIRLEI